MSRKKLVIKPHHIHLAGLCITGARPWFAHHKIEMADLRRGRITTETLAATGDALAQRVIDAARKEDEDGRQ
ncbi:hypothetical protein MO867_20670 [Microbulbifer sp. OS29]|uniref:Uncharacterized protein n=1 Tax=Microbulbifer okhotskensis TaxID=2926617 RepID=A0A9X2ES28_9GAMM|nr:hypothetical protein [Microbulbifer okhotskensis]MCO1336745.1 hypothetical protein [Microbulbifer okhotskensis]